MTPKTSVIYAKPAEMEVCSGRNGASAKPTARSRSRVAWLCGSAIALGFSLWGLRAVGYNNVVDTDGARHAMNGAFVHDLLTRRPPAELLHVSKVIHFAKNYYAHLPALSLPYHPPLFPLVEAAFFSVLGVNVLAARLAIAAAVALSALAIFRLIMATHRSVFVAAFSTISFFCLPYSLWLASDVMLEFPAMVFVVLALRCLADVDAEYSMKRALLFALLAAAAVWTKQQAVFLGAVPFVYIALLGRWRLFRQLPIWVSSGVFLALVAVLATLSLPVAGAGVNQAVPPRGHGPILFHHIVFYSLNIPRVVGSAGVVLLAVFLAATARGLVRRRPAALYVSWWICSMMVLVFLGPYSGRYLFFTVPPIFVLGYAALASMVEHWPRMRRWGMAAAGCVLVAGLAYGAQSPVAFMKGPDEAARMLSGVSPHRILYCGGTDGNFIFSYRSHTDRLDSVVVAGDKLSPDVFTPSALGQFVRRYGLEYVVLESAPNLNWRSRHPWQQVMQAPPPNMEAVRDIPLSSSDYRWNGMLRVYRVTDPSATPETSLTMRMNIVGGSTRFTIERSLRP